MKPKIVRSLWRISAALVVAVTLFAQQAAAITPDTLDCLQLGSMVCFYEPGSCTTPPTVSESGITIDTTAAQQAAQQASTGGINVGYAIYNSTGQQLGSYNNFENYGASITKSMLLVAYLDQVGSGTLSSTAITNLTNMIEYSDNGSAVAPGPAYWVYSNLKNGLSDVTAVASAAGMTGFRPDTSDPEYVLGQSQITADDFAKFFSKINTLIPPAQQSFGLGLLSHLAPVDQNGLLQSGLPGTVYSKEGWKPEPGPTNPFGNEGAPYVVNQAAQFSSGGITYGVAVTVSGTADQSSGEAIVKNVVSALVSPGSSSTSSASSSSCACSTSTTTLTGSDNKQRSWNYFKNKGLSDVLVAGIMGNFDVESHFDPEITSSGDVADPSSLTIPWGIAQWLPGSSVIGDLQANHIFGNVDSLSTQLNLVWAEMNGTPPTSYPNFFQNYSKITNVIQASDFWQNNFEGAMGQATSLREQDSQDALTKYGGTSDGGSPGTTTDGCSGSPDCTSATGDTKILCEAQQYSGIYYEYGGGHQGYSAFVAGCPDPSNPPDNEPYGGAVNGDPLGIGGNPSPCGLDCSGLVSVAVDDAFGQDFMWSVSPSGVMQDGTDANDWKPLPNVSDAQPGDIVTLQDDTGHVEIVDHISGGNITTFGERATSTVASEITEPFSYWTGGAYEWMGPGSSE